MHFSSDNWAGASPKIAEWLTVAATGNAASYGKDEDSKRLATVFGRLFDQPVDYFLSATGTASNALALAALCPANGIVLTHAEAHVKAEEAGAPELFTQGGQLVGIQGANGKITPDALRATLDRLAAADLGYARPAALSLSQATESGTVYTVEDVTALAGIAHSAGLLVHMDGARLANAVARLGCTLDEISLAAGVDALSFGLTKNGAWMAEAVILADTVKADMLWRRKRLGHVVSKARFMAAQFLAMLEEDHWLDLARHANAMAALLSEGIAAAGHRIVWPTEVNEVFAILPKSVIARLEDAGAQFYAWPASVQPGDAVPGEGEAMIRLVTSFATTVEEVDSFLTLLSA